MKKFWANREGQIANIREMPKASEPYTTPMLDQAARAVEDARQRELGPTPIGISEHEERQASARDRACREENAGTGEHDAIREIRITWLTNWPPAATWKTRTWRG